MKSNHLVILIALFASLLYGCTSAISQEQKESAGGANSSVNPIKELNITIRSGKIIEIAYASIEGGKETQIGQEYLPKVLPIVANYGGKMLGSFQVTAVTGGEMRPQMVAIFEWPSLKAHHQLLEDKEAKKLFPLRDDAMTFFKQAYYTVQEDVTVTFSEGKTYEFFNAWLTPTAETSLPEYFKQSKIPKLKYGPPKFLADLKPLKNVPEAEYRLQPHTSGIVEWNSTNAYFGLIADPEFKKAIPLLEQSVTRLDMLHTKVSIPQ